MTDEKPSAAQETADAFIDALRSLKGLVDLNLQQTLTLTDQVAELTEVVHDLLSLQRETGELNREIVALLKERGQRSAFGGI